MTKNDLARRLAVCSWSLQPSDPVALLDALAATGVARVQLALDPLRAEPAVWGKFPELARARGVEIASEVADGPQSVIRDQVRNGVAVRMAVLEAVLGS